METKLCRKCGTVKPKSEFGKDAQKVDGLCWWCKDCMNEAYQRRKAIKSRGCSVTLARYTTEELLNEIKLRCYV